MAVMVHPKASRIFQGTWAEQRWQKSNLRAAQQITPPNTLNPRSNYRKKINDPLLERDNKECYFPKNVKGLIKEIMEHGLIQLLEPKQPRRNRQNQLIKILAIPSTHHPFHRKFLRGQKEDT